MEKFDFFAPDKKEYKFQNRLEARSLRQVIYLCLRESIINKKFKPNERLQEKLLASQFGTSTTPVREAFLKLEAEGYLNINTHRNVIVRSISHSELVEIYQVISILDGYASLLALKNGDRAFFKEIQRLTDKMEKFYKKDMVEEYLKINTQIHSIIWKKAGNKFLHNVLNHIQNQMLRYQAERLSFYSRAGILKKSIISHKKISEAFMNSDVDNIERIVRSHWNISGILT